MKMFDNRRSNGANLGFEEKMLKAADKLRNNMNATEYKRVVLRLILLKYISDAFGVSMRALFKSFKSGPIVKL